MTDAQVTIVVAPRECFSNAARSLESIYEHTDIPFSLVYVDGGSPGRVRRYLAQKARQHDFKLIRTNHYLSPNKARNLGFRFVKTRYVVFMDNDVLVTPGWLAALMNCAEKTGASVVAPVTLMGKSDSQTVHHAGGIVGIREDQGERVFYLEHCFNGKFLTDVAPSLQAGPTDFAEFHCMLMRIETFERVGPLDEQLLSMHEHEDVCLAVRECGGLVYFEPRSVVRFVFPPPLALSDLPYFMLRWSEAWNSASHKHFENKWRLRKNDRIIRLEREWARDHRRTPLRILRGAARRLCRLLGWQPNRIEQALIFPVEMRLNRYLVRLLLADEQNTFG
jgi:glycosyltransferase involved in cell wall biosynthesis